MKITLPQTDRVKSADFLNLAPGYRRRGEVAFARLMIRTARVIRLTSKERPLP